LGPSSVAPPHLRAADLQQVDGLAADVDVVGDVSQEDGHRVLRVLGDQGGAALPEALVCGLRHKARVPVIDQLPWTGLMGRSDLKATSLYSSCVSSCPFGSSFFRVLLFNADESRRSAEDTFDSTRRHSPITL